MRVSLFAKPRGEAYSQYLWTIIRSCSHRLPGILFMATGHLIVGVVGHGKGQVVTLSTCNKAQYADLRTANKL